MGKSVKGKELASGEQGSGGMYSRVVARRLGKVWERRRVVFNPEDAEFTERKGRVRVVG
jgi:hypothetical protein